MGCITLLLLGLVTLSFAEELCARSSRVRDGGGEGR